MSVKFILRRSFFYQLITLEDLSRQKPIMRTAGPFEGILDLVNWRTRNSGVCSASLEQPLNTPKAK